VNKKIAQANRKLIEYDTPDLLTLEISTNTGTIYIHNVYNPSPQQRQPTDYIRPLIALRETITPKNQHIIVGDFNLYYPAWNRASDLTYHPESDTLVGLIGDAGLT